MLNGKRVLLVIGGGIAAYKILELIRRLRERSIEVRVVMTQAAQHFITPLSVASLSGNKVHLDLFSLTDETEMGHIELSRSADLIVVAPATADLLAKMAHGLAQDLASTLLLATDKKILVAPAMNIRMWQHPATQRNVAQLQKDGVGFVGPNEGSMACGEFGPGRMSEPHEILSAIQTLLAGDTRLASPAVSSNLLTGLHILVTSGPTHEPIDPVRYIANRSSGRQGHAIAAAAARAGARVTLISGPVEIQDPIGVQTLHVETAQEMFSQVQASLPADIFIGAAAVADWRVAEAGLQKMKKQGGDPAALKLTENPDILASISKLQTNRPQLVVGFAAETEHVIAHAQAKLARKACALSSFFA
ncbi:MAG: bifunctional phosphopantothenoylcysteine decarboxylase/phosphopantothenate--cysteine ligase CoaBC, partial [Alphaproteobacteria bacterium]|nr:bifunctional phosphopantothenoylcysteine decarboxylase/phosphopantothenate--cysteine ligase CoaBC [Alphaproteobacteria bacterium]